MLLECDAENVMGENVAQSDWVKYLFFLHPVNQY